MQKVNWGIIGCGDVTEVKSGPAFNKVPNSALVAVMRRDAAKAQDYAQRHGVPAWYSNAEALINDANVNAIYIATPPSSHEKYTLKALAAGKPVYVEKPMTLDAESAIRLMNAANESGVKLTVAHYRREQPYFKKIKTLILENAIGDIRFARMHFCKRALLKEELRKPGVAWRVSPETSGGGLFHDLAPHGLDLMYYFFGVPEKVNGFSINQQKAYAADDLVTGSVVFKNGVVFNGLWCFSVNETNEQDWCEIVGANGSIRFSVFGAQQLTITINEQTEAVSFSTLPHVQQPMIEAVVQYFLGAGANPCSAEEGVQVMQLIDSFTKK